MVIFCVIAFVLLWSPFNALIVIGDIEPGIWEHHNIMYIWFITHYLAMCHTITNPLIYIWMNNRFRAGFKQVIGDVCKFMRGMLTYLFCYCLCLGCCLKCSRRKYARITLEMDREHARRRPLTSSGSSNPYINNGNNHHQCTSTLIAFGTAGQTGRAGSGPANANYYHTDVAKSAKSANLANSANSANLANRSEGNALGKQVNNDLSGDLRLADVSTCDRPLASGRVCISRLEIVGPLAVDERQLQTCNPHQKQEEHGRNWHQSDQRSKLETMESSLVVDCADNQVVAGAVGKRSSCLSRSNERSPSGHNITGPSERHKRRRNRRDGQRSVPLGKPPPSGRLEESSKAVTVAKRKRRRRQTHAICLQMTTSKFYTTPNAQDNGQQLATTTTTTTNTTTSRDALPLASHAGAGQTCRRAPICGSRSKSKHRARTDYSHDCPGCFRARARSLGMTDEPPASSSGVQPYATTDGDGSQGHVRFGQFTVDTCQSSQSTATISAQTNNTSLAMSSISSMKCSGEIDEGGPDRKPASNNTSNNTSASLSANGLGYDLANEEADAGISYGKSAPVAESNEHDCRLDFGGVEDGDAKYNNSIDDGQASTVARGIIIKRGASAAAQPIEDEMELMELMEAVELANSNGSNNSKLDSMVDSAAVYWCEPTDSVEPSGSCSQSPPDGCVAGKAVTNNADGYRGRAAIAAAARSRLEPIHGSQVIMAHIGQIDARSRECFTRLSDGAATSFEGGRPADCCGTLGNCNQAAVSNTVHLADYDKLLGTIHQRPGVQQNLSCFGALINSGNANNKSQQELRTASKQEVCVEVCDQRQAISALEVDRLLQWAKSMRKTGCNGLARGKNGTNVVSNRNGEVGHAGSDEPELQLYGILGGAGTGGINAIRANNDPDGTKSTSALELISDRSLGENRVLVYERIGCEPNEDNKHADRNSDCDQLLSPRSASDMELNGRHRNHSTNEGDWLWDDSGRDNDKGGWFGFRLMMPLPIGRAAPNGCGFYQKQRNSYCEQNIKQ
jgi:hypothetical protein